MKKINLIFSVAVFVLLSSAANAAEISATVTRYNSILDRFTVGQQIESGTQVMTDQDEVLDIVLNNSIGARLLPDTDAVIKSSAEGQPVLSVARGNVILNVLKTTPPVEFSVETPVCVASVRGTQFWGRVMPIGADGVNTFAVREGSVEVEHAVTGRSILVHAGEALDLNSDGTTFRVRPALEPELNAMRAADQISTSA